MRAMPVGTVETFTTTVQPMLLNSCATAGCHGTGATSPFVLSRPALGSAMPRRLTQRNLSNALQWIDREKPMESKLLSSAKDPHAPNQASGAAGLDPAKYQELVAWVWQTCNGKTRAPATLTAPEKAPQAPGQSPVLASPIGGATDSQTLNLTKPSSTSSRKSGAAKATRVPAASIGQQGTAPDGQTPTSSAAPGAAVTPSN